ncbi:hypothetical protein [Nocardia sp. NPDC004722]
MCAVRLMFALIGLIRYRAFVLSLIVPALLINLTDLPQSLTGANPRLR